MQKTSIILAVTAILGLAGCLEGDVQRGAAGAGAGLVASQILDTDPVGTAAAGAAAGILCDDAGINGCR